ncbi:MAG: lipopolysaccharide assembly protein LptD [Sodalis sp. Psp]|nr:lipopolysaccharide assembly protein LptD [Sodalis sp. Psp]MCR3757331.1 lipopolysaccharide assembly protein LptD [Sodalis sp. Ppy]
MKKRFSSLLANLIWSALYSQHALADLAKQCLLGVPTYIKPLVNDNPNSLPVYIRSDKAQANYHEQVTLFSGNVDIEQGNSMLSADQVTLHQRQKKNDELVRIITAIGNVTYTSNEIKLTGLKAWSNLNTKDIYIYQGNYQMIGRQGRGNADALKQHDNNCCTVLENGSFTTCLPGDDSWSVAGSEVTHDHQEQVVKIRNARFKIGKVPIFYSPYLQMSVGDKRRSGFLTPNAIYGNSSGFEFSAPYCLNLTPKYDTTITPNYMSKRGMQIQTEFRYLTTLDKGLVELDWLPNDRNYNCNHGNDRDDRWLFCWRHSGVMEMWRFNINYAKVSDSSYFDDLYSKYGSTTDGYTTQKFSFGYTDENWDTSLSYKQFQVFDTRSYTYRSTPQLDLIYYKNDVGPFNFKMFSQAAQFTNFNKDYPKATRLHIEPMVSLPLANHWGRLNAEAKLMTTHYQQKNIGYYNKNISTGRHLEGLVNRILPQFKTEGKMIFERKIDYSQGYTQTLEPQLQYLYVPYCNQNNIGVYDSTILQTDYSGLFRDHFYSGLDRILSADQLAGGVVTRIYDDQSVERFNVSMGQIYYFSWPRTGDITGTWDKYDNTGSVVWTGDSYWRINNQWGIRSSLQYDVRLNSVALGDVVLEYRCDEDRVLQLNYRYANPQYIQQILSDSTNSSHQQGISQVGIIGSWPLVDLWSLVGKYYYDAKGKQPVNQLVGLQYNTCCWAINAGFERKIISWNSSGSSSKYDNKMSFNIELRGLINNYGLGTNKMLLSGIFPYHSIL